MNLESLKKIGTEIDTILRIKTPSMGVVYCTKDTNIPIEKFTVIDHPIPLCSVSGLSRFFELNVYISREMLLGQCGGVDGFLFNRPGNPQVAEEYKKRHVFTENEEQAHTFGSMKKHMDKDVTGVAFFPLKDAPMPPDVCQIWGNPLQTTFVVYSHAWTLPQVKLTNGGGTDAHGGSCYEGGVIPYLEKRINLVTLDMGDRKHGHAGDEETMIAFPLCELERLHYGMVSTQNTRHRLPVMYDFESSSFPVKKEYLERKGPNFA